MRFRWIIGVLLLGVPAVWFPSRATAQLQPNNVLVVYNSKGADTNGSGQSDSVDVLQYYQQARPGVLTFDLNDASLSSGNVSYADFIAKIRDPLRNHLSVNNIDRQVAAITLTRGLPHRILDINAPNLGDEPGNATIALSEGNATYASVDSELTLLWQPLNQSEANKRLDSFADNAVFNPYHNAAKSIVAFNRGRIGRTKSFAKLGNSAWEMRESPNGIDSDAGNIYLTSRLDGNSVADVLGMIDRGRYPSYNQFEDLLLFDENSEGDLDNLPLFSSNNVGHLGDDYDESAAQFGPIYDKVLFNEDSLFLIGKQPFVGSAATQVVTNNVALLSSYGGNHGGDATGYVQTFAGQFSNGAIMNTLESYNAKQFGGLGGFNDQGQLSDFVAAGGTFGVGQSWEPFAFSLADDEVLLDRFLFGDLTWVESAWSSIPWLSWQQVVIGDPLSTATLILDAKPIVWNGRSSSGSPGDGMNWSDAKNWARGGVADGAFEHGDAVTFSNSASGTVNVDGPRIVQSLSFANNYRLRGDDLAIRSGDITVTAEVTATIESNIYSSVPITKLGAGTLFLSGIAPSTIVQAGTLGGVAELAALQVNSGGRVLPGGEDSAGVLRVNGDFDLAAGGHLVVNLDGNTANSFLDVDGRATLDGSLELVPINQHHPPTTRGVADSFTLLRADSVVGEFQSILYDGSLLNSVSAVGVDAMIGHVENGLFATVNYTDTEVSLTNYFALPGDANGDMVVDSNDLSIWTANRFTNGTTWTSGDFNNDGLTDGADFNVWNANIGRVAVEVFQVAAVPESSSLRTLLACLLVTFFGRRKK